MDNKNGYDQILVFDTWGHIVEDSAVPDEWFHLFSTHYVNILLSDLAMPSILQCAHTRTV